MKKLINKYQSGFIAMFNQVAVSAMSFLLTIYLAHTLPAAIFGEFAWLMIVCYAVIATAGSLIAGPLQVNPDRTNPTFQRIIRTSMTSMLVIGLLLYVIVSNGIIRTDIPATWILYATGFVFNEISRRILLAYNLVKRILLSDLINGLTQLILIYCLTHFASIDVNGLPGFLAFSFLVPIFIFFLPTKKEGPQQAHVSRTILSHFKEGGWLATTAMVQWSTSNLLILTSGYYLGVEAIGALRIVQSAFGVLNVLLQFTENYMVPRITDRAQGDHGKLPEIISSMNKPFMIGMFLMISTFVIFSDTLIQIIGGEQYKPYAFLITGMSLVYLMVVINQPLRMAVRIMVLNKHLFTGSLISLGLSLVALDYLISHHQLNGVLAGLMLSQISVLVYYGYILRKKQYSLWKSFI